MPFCAYHVCVIMRLFSTQWLSKMETLNLSMGEGVGRDLPDPPVIPKMQFEYLARKMPELVERWDVMRKRCALDPGFILFIDWEFQPVRNPWAPIPWEVAVVNAEGRHMLEVIIDHGTSFEEFWETLSLYMSLGAQRTQRRHVELAFERKNMRAALTGSKALSEKATGLRLRKVLSNLGPLAVLVNWYSPMDLELVARVTQHSDATRADGFLVSKEHLSVPEKPWLHTFVLGLFPDMASGGLQYVWGAMFPTRPNKEWHHAIDDAEPLREIFMFLIHSDELNAHTNALRKVCDDVWKLYDYRPRGNTSRKCD